MRAFLRYTLSRLVLLVAVAALLYAVGLRGFAVPVLALLLSLPLSYVLLSRQRAALGAEVERRVAQRRERHEQLRSQLRGDGPAPS